jgi:hypothetical protein
VYGNPLRYIDPSGHDPRCGPDGIYCGVDPTQATTGSLLGPQWNNNSGSGSTGGGGNSNSGSSDIPSCGYHHCGETFDIVEAYELGWQNFGQAWDIYWNPNATREQKFVAGAYMGVWSGAHAGLVLGSTVLLWKALVPGSMSCAMSPACGEKVAGEAGKSITVLGRWPLNKQVAEAIGGKYLNIPTATWERLNESGRWALNQKWLDKAIARGDTFILASKWADAGTSYYFKELQYLFSKGYTISVYQNYLIPPP